MYQVHYSELHIYNHENNHAMEGSRAVCATVPARIVASLSAVMAALARGHKVCEPAGEIQTIDGADFVGSHSCSINMKNIWLVLNARAWMQCAHILKKIRAVLLLEADAPNKSMLMQLEYNLEQFLPLLYFQWDCCHSCTRWKRCLLFESPTHRVISNSQMSSE